MDVSAVGFVAEDAGANVVMFVGGDDIVDGVSVVVGVAVVVAGVVVVVVSVVAGVIVVVSVVVVGVGVAVFGVSLLVESFFPLVVTGTCSVG